MTRPILFALGFLILGIVVGNAAADFFAFFFIAAVFVCAFLYRMFRYTPVIIFALFFLVGAWRVEHSLFSHTIAETEAAFTGIVLDTGYTAGGNQRAVIRGEHPQTGGRVRVMAYIRPHQRHVSLGQEVTVTGELLPLTRAVNPEGYDQFQHLRSQKIDATIWPQSIQTGETRRTLTVMLRQFRDRIAAVYDTILPARESAVIKSMVLGDRLDLDRDLADLYRVMGIFHILSISGLHVTILMVAANKLLSLFLEERRAGLIVLTIMLLYCLMTGAAVATVRAVTMGGVLVGAKILYREYDLLASVSLACIALLIYEPLYLFNAGFQLSFGAVYGIGTLTAPIERLIKKTAGALPPPPHKGTGPLDPILFGISSNASIKSLSVGIAAVVSTYIIFAFHFYEIPLYSVLGNLVIAPTVTIILVLGVIVGLVGLVSMPVAELLAGAVYFILRFYEAAAIFFSGLPFAMIRTGGGNVIVSALGVLVLCMFAYTFHGFGQNFRNRMKVFAVTVLVLVVAVFVNANPFSLQVTSLYTHGNYMVLRRANDTLVIGALHGGEAELLRYLDKRGTNRAALLLTHPPRPTDTERLARILPRIHTIYLPAHAEGVTESLMHATLHELPLDEIRIVFLQDGDKRITRDVSVQVSALPMGQFHVNIHK
ncbi:MAG: competence protein ComEC family protein [Defluviitaleaceae bacterium]|nr:competence protein ComEC family protein [Defluviitaleaceae bacterium]MCL2262040.1 competence protein ComEC family protein [Defluviitaleaceae bacterium]